MLAAEDAAIDTTGLKPDQTMSLAGTWQFYREMLVDGVQPGASAMRVAVPAEWQNYPDSKAAQYGTFELALKTSKGTAYQLHIPRIFTAVRVLIDGKVVYEAGRVGKDAGSHSPAITNGVVQFSARESITHLFFQVSNFSLPYGGIFYPPAIELATGTVWRTEFLLEFGIILLFIAGAFYHGLLQLSWKRDRSHVLFAAALLSVTLRTAMSGQDVIHALIPSLDWSLHYRLEFTGLYLMVITMYAFVFEVTDATNLRWLRTTGISAGLLLLLPVFILPVSTFTALLGVFQAYTVIAVGTGVFLVVRAIRARIRFWQWYLVAAVLFAGAAVADIIAARFGVKNGYITKHAFLLFILLQAGILNAVFLDAFRNAEKINVTLQREIAVSEGELVESHRQNETLLKVMMADVQEARMLQESLLPKEFPEVRNLRVYGRYLPMDLVGGDMYAFARHADGRFGCLIADVSGHGIAAATVAASTRLLYSLSAQTTSSPAQILRLLNERLPDHIGRHFLTAICVVFDAPARKLSMANAGHPPMLVVSGGVARSHNAKGTVLGAFSDLNFHEVDFDLAPGDRIVLYTDGLVEGREPAEYETGVQRLCQLLETDSQLPLRQWIDRTVERATSQMGAGNLPDDITLVAFEVV